MITMPFIETLESHSGLIGNFEDCACPVPTTEVLSQGDCACPRPSAATLLRGGDLGIQKFECDCVGAVECQAEPNLNAGKTGIRVTFVLPQI